MSVGGDGILLNLGRASMYVRKVRRQTCPSRDSKFEISAND